MDFFSGLILTLVSVFVLTLMTAGRSIRSGNFKSLT